MFLKWDPLPFKRICASDFQLNIHRILTFTTIPFYNKKKRIAKQESFDCVGEDKLNVQKTCDSAFDSFWWSHNIIYS